MFPVATHRLFFAFAGEAETLRTHFEEKFWGSDLNLYALALDGHKKQCRVRASNAGYSLFTGIASPERARRVADELMGADFFTGWGIRTVAGNGIPVQSALLSQRFSLAAR